MKSPLVFSKKSIRYSYCTCNFYTGCENNCEYCCLNRISINQFKPKARLLFQNEEAAIRLFVKAINEDFDNIKKYGVFFSLTTDPLLHSTKDLTYRAAIYCLDNDIPFKILTKRADWANDDFIVNYPKNKKHLGHFGFSLSGFDNFEKGASSSGERADLLKKLYNEGFKTWVSAEPIIDIEETKKIIKEIEPYSYMIRLETLTPAKYKDPALSYKFDPLDLMDFYKWLKINVKETLVYLGDGILKNSKINMADFPTNFTETGDLIREYDKIHQKI